MVPYKEGTSAHTLQKEYEYNLVRATNPQDTGNADKDNEGRLESRNTYSVRSRQRGFDSKKQHLLPTRSGSRCVSPVRRRLSSPVRRTTSIRSPIQIAT